MRALSLKNLNVRLSEFQLVDIEMEVAENEFMVILGPSGAGKTVLLETIVGFHPLVSGEIFLYDREISSLLPEERGIGIIFQDYALFPHLTVQQNILFGSRYKYYPDKEKWYEELVELLQLKPFLNRLPHTLSGGEQQRVCIARAMMVKPSLLLFDEPMSALDEPLRNTLREELKTIVKQLNQTVIYVTHDQVEAAILGDRIAVMERGRIIQVGTPNEIFYHPINKNVAQFTGIDTIVTGRIKTQNEGIAIIDVNGVEIEAITYRKEGEEVTLCIRAENVGIVLEKDMPSKTSIRNSLPAKITKIIMLGPIIKLELFCGVPLTAIITKQSFEELNLQVGNMVIATFKAVAVHVM